MGNLLEGVMHAGKADILGVTYEVKSNGKSGLEIRYFLNPIKQEAPIEEVPLEENPFD